MTKEAKARILINDLLQRSDWRFFDDENSSANVALEAHVKIKKNALDALGEDFEKTANGFVDYLLLDRNGFPVAVLEAKSEKYDPLIGKEQARKYAHSQNVRFVILSNGNLHYFWDLEQGNPVLITEFPKPESFGHFHVFKPNPEALISETVESDYIAVCVRQDHATRIVKKLNEMAHALFPGKYNSDFAVQVTSNQNDPQGTTASFANNNPFRSHSHPSTSSAKSWKSWKRNGSSWTPTGN